MRKLFATALLLLIVLGAGPAQSQNSQISGELKTGNDHLQPTSYCGLEAFLSAAFRLGKPIEPKELLDKKYMSSPDGSSAADLVQAAKDFGFGVAAVRRQHISSLEEFRYRHAYPLLHVKSNFEATAPDHWILYVGQRRDQAVVSDGAKLSEVPIRLLEARWRGDAVVVFNAGDYVKASSLSPSELRLWLITGSMAVLLGLVASRLPPNKSKLQTLLYGAGLIAVAIPLAFLYDRVSNGVHYSREAVNFVNESKAAELMPTVKLHRGEPIPQDWVVIDARSDEEYQQGHIPGSIHVDARWTMLDVKEELKGVGGNQKIVVYCSNRRCKNAEMLAVRLKRNGYDNVSVFRGGWDAWRREL